MTGKGENWSFWVVSLENKKEEGKRSKSQFANRGQDDEGESLTEGKSK